MTDVPIHSASTILLLRDDRNGVEVLMGQRGAKAVFMPDKFVFPGGRVDADDHDLPEIVEVAQSQREALEAHADPGHVNALSNAAVRELWEETGLIMGQRGPSHENVPDDWKGFYRAGWRPDGSPLSFFFRAITPPGRPRRFDARFFMANASAVQNDLDDFSEASGELSHLQWIPLEKVRNFALPFITEIVLSELEDILRAPLNDRPIPFFNHDDEGPSFRVISKGST